MKNPQRTVKPAVSTRTVTEARLHDLLRNNPVTARLCRAVTTPELKHFHAISVSRACKMWKLANIYAVGWIADGTQNIRTFTTEADALTCYITVAHGLADVHAWREPA